MDIAITKMSSRGQIVIPQEIRKDITEGEKLVVLKDKNQIIVKKMNKMYDKFLEDLEFAKETEGALERINNGKCTKMEFDDFIKEMKKW